MKHAVFQCSLCGTVSTDPLGTGRRSLGIRGARFENRGCTAFESYRHCRRGPELWEGYHYNVACLYCFMI